MKSRKPLAHALFTIGFNHDLYCLPMSKTIVICVNNGQQFPTIAAAAEWAGVDRRRIRDAIQRGTQAAGRRWGRINPSDLNEP